MALHTSVWDGCPLWAWGQGAETWGWEGGPRKAPAVDCEETTWGVGNEELCKQECSWRKLRPPQRGSTIVEWCASLLMCQPLPPWALWRAHPPPRARTCVPTITSPTLLSPSAWATCSPQSLTALLDGIVCYAKLWSRLWWKEQIQRWGWSHSWNPGAMRLRRRAEHSPCNCTNHGITPPLMVS